MAMQRQLWSINALSTELGTDRRTLAKRLGGLRPAKEEPKLYLLRDVLLHLRQYDGDLQLDDHMTYARRAMHITVMSLAESLHEQLPKTLRKLVPCDAKKAKALSADLLFVYSWFAFGLATEGFRCEDQKILSDIAQIGKRTNLKSRLPPTEAIELPAAVPTAIGILANEVCKNRGTHGVAIDECSQCNGTSADRVKRKVEHLP
jgi:hypothetical protein